MLKEKNQKLAVNIFGLPGVGKPTLRNALIELFGDEKSGKLPGDYYLESKPSDISFQQYFTRDYYDWELLKDHLNKPLGEIINPPLFDFSEFIRISDNGHEKKFKINRLIFVDTVEPCPFADLRILITLASHERKERIIRRGRSDYFWKNFILENWEYLESFENEKQKKFRESADLIVNGSSSLESYANKAYNLIKCHFNFT